MKKILVSLLLCLSFACFAACDKQPSVIQGGVPDSFDGYVTVVLDDPATEAADVYFQVTYADIAEGWTAFDLLKELADENKIFYEGSDSTYGFYFTSIGYIDGENRVEIAKDDTTAKTFVSFYTSVEKDLGGMTPIQYGDKTLESSAVGASSMSLEDGAVIFITEGTY